MSQVVATASQRKNVRAQPRPGGLPLLLAMLLCSTVLAALPVASAAALSSASASLSDTIAGDTTQVAFVFGVQTPWTAGQQFKATFPGAFLTATAASPTLTSTSCSFGTATIAVSGQAVTVTRGAVPAQDTTCSAGASVTLTIGQIGNPATPGSYTIPIQTQASSTPVDTGSVSVTVTNAAAKLVFSTQPGPAAINAPLTVQPVVQLVDTSNNVVADSTHTVTLSLTTPGGASLGGTTTVTAANGAATFSSLSVDTTGSYTFTATTSAGGFTKLSSTFTISNGVATDLIFARQPGASTSTAALSPQPQLQLVDNAGNPVADSTHTVTVSLAGASGAILSGATTMTLQNGIATFAGLSIDRADTYHLSASTTAGTQTAQSSDFTVSIGSASRLVFSVSPGGAAATQPFGPQPELQLQDAGGNIVSTDNTHTVSLAISSGPSGAVLAGTTTVTLQNGVATFAGLAADKAGAYTLLATTDAGSMTRLSASLTVVPGPATHVVFVQQPVGGPSTSALGQQPSLELRDAGENVLTSDSQSTVTVRLTTAGGATLSGASTVAVSGGAAAFSGLAVDKVGTYTLTASTSAGSFTALSTSFTIGVGPASRLVFTTQPLGGAATSPLATQPVLQLQDANGNRVTTDSTHTVTLALTSPGSATLSGTKTLTLSGGQASFANLGVDKTGTYTFTATTNAGSFTALSTSFTMTPGVATQLVYTTQPVGAAATMALATQPVVQLQDANGNLVTGDNTDQVTVALTAAGGATLSGTTTATLSGGIATFSGLSVDKSGSYTLTASMAGLTKASSSFTIAVGAPASLAFSTQPGGGTSQAAFGTQPVVQLRDAGGNLVGSDSTHKVTLVLTTPAGATLAGTATKTLASGVATFSGLSVDKSGTYTLTASTDAGSFQAISSTFTIVPGAAARVAFVQQPTGATGGQALAQQPRVAIQDAAGNTLSGSTSTVTVALTTAAGATLQGPTTVTVASGVATFSGLSVDKAGSYTFTATTNAGSFTATSASFTITVGAGTQLVYSKQPVGAASQVALATQPAIKLLDAGGNLVADNTNTVTLALSSPGSASLAGSTTVTFAGGVATFAGLSVDKSGAYTLTATTSAGAFTRQSSSFTITAGPATHLVFTASPSGSTGGQAFATQPVVELRDAMENVVASDNSHAVTVDVSGPGAGSVSGTSTVTLQNGVAAFSGLSVDKTGTYTLTATTNAGTYTATSASFTITTGPAARVQFTVQPGGAHTTMPVASPSVMLVDAGGNTVADSTHTVTVTLTSAGSAVLGGTTTRTLAGGAASFPGLSVDTAGTYTLTVNTNAPAASAGQSASFTITSGAASKLAFVTQPGGAASASALAPQPVVAVQDSAGNAMPDNTGSVTLALTTPGGASLSGITHVNVVNGVATFTGLSVDKVGTYTLTASTSAGSFTAASSSLAITPGAAARLVFSRQPGGAASAQSLAPQPVVQLQDAAGNVVSTDNTHAVTLALTAANGATLSGTRTVRFASGFATFTDLAQDKAGTYSLTATTDAGSFAATSSAYIVTTGPATHLGFSTQPGDAASQSPLSPQPVVQLLDAGNNLITDNTHSVTLALTSSAGATLSGTLTAPFSGGTATFAGLSVDKAAAYTLSATTDAGTFTAVSSAFTVTHGAAHHLLFTTQAGSSTGGQALSSAPTVELRDAAENLVGDSTASVTLTLSPGGSLSGVTTRALSGGHATFPGLAVDKAGSYTLTAASDAGVPSLVGSAFAVAVGPAAQLAVATQPGDAASTQALAPAAVFELRDAGGNVVADSTHSVHVGLQTAAGASLSGTQTVTFVSGAASFTGLSIDRAGTYRLAATTDAGAFTATTSTFTVTVGPATQLSFAVQPVGSTGGLALATQPVVQLLDAGGNLVSDSSHQVTLSGPATMTGPATASLASGVASFAGLAVSKAGTYTFTATTDAGAFTATSASFAVAVGPAARVVFSSQPGGAASQQLLAPQPVVDVQDAGGNLVTDSPSVALAILPSVPVTGTATRTASGGQAAFTDLAVAAAGTYTLTATAGGLQATSSPFTIAVGSPAGLVFSSQPGDAVSQSALAQQPVVRLVDAAGNLVADSTHSVTLTAAPASGLSGTSTVQLASGVATFSGLALAKAGAFALVASTDAGAFTGTSATFHIVAGPAAQVAFVTQPIGGPSGTLATQPVVELRDAAGNRVVDTGHTVTLGGQVTGTMTRALVDGRATFTDLAQTQAGTYVLSATTDAGAFRADSAPFTIVAGTPAALVFTVQPANASATSPVGTLQVELRDAAGNLVATNSGSVSLSLTTPDGATLSGTATRTFAGGVASFPGLSVDHVGTYALTARTSLGSFTSQSAAFSVATGPAAAIAFGLAPSGATSQQAFGTQPTLRLLDAGGNLVDDSTHTATLSLVPGTLAGTAIQPFVHGVATFSGLSVAKAGTYTLAAATDAGSMTVRGSPFVVQPGQPAALHFARQPGALTAGTASTATPRVEVLDAAGNLVTGATGTIHLALDAANGGAVTPADPVATLHSGSAQWTSLAVDLPGTYTLTATYGDLQATSDPFAVTAGEPVALVLVVQPHGGPAGQVLPTQPVLALEDAHGNVVPDSVHNVTVAMEGGPLSGTTHVAFAAGRAAFTDLSIGASGTYVFHFATDAITGTATSSSFVVAGRPSNLVFTTQPGNGVALVALPTQPVVALLDDSGQIDTTRDSGTVTLVPSGPTGAAFSGITTVTFVHGVATFDGLALDKAGQYILSATTSVGPFTASTAPLRVQAGPAVGITFVRQPADAQVAALLSPGPQVALVDASGNVATSDTAHSVTLTLVEAAAATLHGTTVRGASAGIAGFDDLTVDTSGRFTLLATTDAGNYTATSHAFLVRSAAPAGLAFTHQPTGGASGATFTATVELRDRAGKLLVGDSTHQVTLALKGKGGQLTGTLTAYAEHGVATFTDLAVAKAGTYALTAVVDGAKAGAVSKPFTVTPGPAVGLVFTTQPANVASLAKMPTVRVALVDAAGNPVGDSTHSVLIAIDATEAHLGGAASARMKGGQASFGALTVDRVGTYTLMASLGDLSVTSAPFTVKAGKAATLVLTTQPGSAAAGSPLDPQPVYEVRDAAGNLVADNVHTVTVTLAAGKGLTGTTTVRFVDGVAAFQDLGVTAAGNVQLKAKTNAGPMTVLSDVVAVA